MSSLPTRTELAKRVATFNRRYRMLAAVYFGACFGIAATVAAAALSGFTMPFENWGSIIVLSSLAIVIFGGAFLHDHRREVIARQERLACPSCGKPLIHANAKLAVTTGRCAECGAPVVSDL
jgi:hypothetical protein